MINNLKKVQPGWLIPETVKDKFRDFCIEKGENTQESCAAALTLFCYLPAQVREWARLVAKGLIPADEEFRKEFAGGVAQQLTQALQDQNNSLQAKPVSKSKK